MSTNKTLNTLELMNGTDGCLYVEFNGVNVPILEMENYSISANFAGVDRQFVGDPVVKFVPTGISFSLTLSESVVRDDLIVEPMLESIKKGRFPHYNFQGKVEKPDGQEQRIALNDVVPNGAFGLQNVTPGEIISREMNFSINTVPEFISSLVATYM